MRKPRKISGSPAARALITPRKKRSTREILTETMVAWSGHSAYGANTMIPARRYETNMTPDPASEDAADTNPLCRHSRTDSSERKLPTAMENASTTISTPPANRMVGRSTWAEATPDTNPTVDTKESSTPKMKFRKNPSRTPVVYSIKRKAAWKDGLRAQRADNS